MSDPIHVLYVDDEPVLLDIGKLYLEQDGQFRVTGLSSAEEALATLKEGSFDAIVSDYMMPEMNGISFLKEIRNRGVSIPFILFTGRGREEVVIEAFDNGADSYVQKGGEPRQQFVELSHKISQAVQRREAERKLRDSEERYRSVVEDQTEFICRKKPDRTLIFVNDAFCRYYNVTREEITGTRFIPPIFEADIDAVEQLLKSLTPDNPVRTIEHRVVSGDGKIKWQQWVDRGIFDTQGRCIEIQSVGRDITVAKEAEETVSYFGKILDDSLNEIYLFDAISYRFIEVNRGARENLRYSMDELSLLTPIDIKPEFTRDKFESLIKPLLDGKEEKTRFSTIHKRKDSTTYPVEVHLQIMNMQERRLFVAIILDITSRRRAESALTNAEERFRILFRQSPIPYQSLDEDGKFLDVNDAWLETLGYSYDEVVGNWFGDFIISEHQGLFRERFPMFKDIGRVHGIEFRMKKKNEETILVSFDGNIGKNPDGSFRQTHCVFRDITREREAELSLIDREERLNQAIHGGDLGTWDWDIPSGRIAINDRWASMIGYAPDEIVPHYNSWIELVHPDDLPGVLEALRETIEGKIPHFEFRYRLKGKNGDWIWVLDKGKVITRSTDGSPIRAVGTHLDITGVQLIRDHLRGMNQYHRGLIEASIDSFVTINEQGKMTDVNKATEKLTGYSRDDLIGKDFSDYFTDADTARIGSRIAFEKGVIRDYPLEIRHRNGTITPVLYNASVYHDQEGRIVGIFAVARDVTNIRKTEAELKASESFLNAVLDSLQDAIGMQKTDHRIIRYNRAGYELLHKTPDEVIGKRCYELIGRTSPCEDCATTKSLVSKKMEQTERFVPELGLWLDCRSKPLLDEKGEVAFIVEQLIDVTQRKQAEEALKEANQKLRLLTGLTRHDILNQLSALQAFHDLILQTSDPEVIHTRIKQSQDVCDRIEQIIGFTREYEDFGIVSSGWHRIKPLIRSACYEVRLGGMHLTETIHPGLEVYADPIIRKVFTTLLENAIRHGKDITRITVSSKTVENSLIIMFEDDGTGVEEWEKDMIFDHGYGKHTGIGLFLAREILAITGLSISETGKPLEGARFEIFVPEGKYRFA
ncbi:MAG TPA: PAS domain S-box protein [Methanospirillum sp.]|uniref:hybrid sensor histidine kinase/response regulator n=1 Tax=Methanospirillum sp. TaxID=45200 RepID=UPI002BC238A0|nr:PAS domain S-box protein [Methanospirillum sp.]HWQ63076.1 PAS domain S-box protein [Methanospirillum sp.]